MGKEGVPRVLDELTWMPSAKNWYVLKPPSHMSDQQEGPGANPGPSYLNPASPIFLGLEMKHVILFTLMGREETRDHLCWVE